MQCKRKAPQAHYMIKSTLKIGAFVLAIVAASGVFYLISNHLVFSMKP